MATIATYVSSSSFTIEGEYDHEYPAGRKLKLLMGVDGTDYVVVTSSSYASGTGLTTVNVSPSTVTSNLVAIERGASSPASVGHHEHTGADDGKYMPASALSEAQKDQIQDFELYEAGDANKIWKVDSSEDSVELTTIQGTTDQVEITFTDSTITIALPQDIATGSSPEFAGLTLTGESGIMKATAGALGGVAKIDHGTEVDGLGDNDHPQYVPSTDWKPPPFQYKDADEITVIAGRYHKGGHKLYGHYQNLTGMASYWDVAANFDVDIDATYSAGSTSGMLGGKVNSSWYGVFMVAADELLVLPMIRVDAHDYDTSYSGKTTINPAAHSDGTSAENGFLAADDQWNNYRLVKLDLADPSRHGTILTVEDCVNGTPDELVIDGDQSASIDNKDWFLLIPPSATSFVYLGPIRIDGSGNLRETKCVGGVWRHGDQVTIAGTLNTTPALTDLNSGVPPTANAIIASLHVQGASTTGIEGVCYSDSGGSNTLVETSQSDGDTDTKEIKSPATLVPIWETAGIYNKFTKDGPSAADAGNLNIAGWAE